MHRRYSLFLLLYFFFLPFVSAVEPYVESKGQVTDTSQFVDTKVSWLNSKFVKQSVAPAALASTSLFVLSIPDLKFKIQEQMNWNSSESINLFDDELRYVPMGAVAALSLLGVKGKHSIWEEMAIGGLSYILADFIVYRTKIATHITRPNPIYGNESFPSQHASMAFVGATLLHREFGSVSPWISIAGYGIATWVAYARIARNRHFLPDVLMGSAVGIFSTNATFWVFDALAPKFKNGLSYAPRLTETGGELVLSYQF
ncbi:MAG TPA: phosphatase PAP2 family protein [Bacteroidales bacterium]|nr:phosphatase PAP2 family protein [Bacteroidales bacterium]